MSEEKKSPKIPGISKEEPKGRWQAFKERRDRWWQENQVWVILTLLVMSLILLFLFDRIFISIHSGQQGVLWKRFSGTVTSRVYDEGFHIIWPFDIMYIYNVRKQIVTEDLSMLSSDGLAINIKFSARFHPKVDPPDHKDALNLPLLHKRLGVNYIDTVVRPEVVAAFRSVIGNYTPEQIYAADEDGLRQEIIAMARKQLEGGAIIQEDGTTVNVVGNYLILDDMLIHELNLPDKVEDAISEKLTRKHQFLAYAYILKKEEEEAKRREIEASGIKAFQEMTGVSILQWRGIEATKELAASNNAKFVIMGNNTGSLPVILNMGGSSTGVGAARDEDQTEETGAQTPPENQDPPVEQRPPTNQNQPKRTSQTGENQ